MANQYAGTPFESEWEKLERKKAINKALLQQSLAPYRGTQQTGSGRFNFAVDDRLGEGISKIGNALIARYQNKQIEDESQALEDKYSTERAKAIESITNKMQGVPEKPYELSPDEQFDGEQIPGLKTAAVAPDRQGAVMEAATSPYLKDSGVANVVAALTAPQKKEKQSYEIKQEGAGDGLVRDVEVVNGVRTKYLTEPYRKSMPSTNVTTNVGGDIKPTEFEKMLGKKEAEAFTEEQKQAKDAVTLLQSNNEALRLMDEGMVSGAFAGPEVTVGKILHRIGINYKKDEIDNAQAYLASSAKRVAAIIQAFGAGTGLSDADREYAKAAAAGDISMNEEALRNIIDINRRAAEYAINKYNEKADAVQNSERYKANPIAPYSLNVRAPEGWSAYEGATSQDKINAWYETQEKAKTRKSGGISAEKEARFRERLERERQQERGQ